MHKRFRGKTIVITQAGTTLARGVAIRFAQEGANLALIDSDKQALMETFEQLPEDTSWLHENHYLTISCDVTNEAQVAKMVSAIDSEFEHMDVLVSHDRMLSDEFLQAMMPYLRKVHGNLVHVSPSAVSDTADGDNHVQAMAKKYAANGVRVNEVSYPSQMKVDSNADKQETTQTPATLLGSVCVDNVIDGITFLASEEASMITGISLPVDAGVRLSL